MFDIDKSIKQMIGDKKIGGKNDWDFDGVPNKRDCQPRNTMRQDTSIKGKPIWTKYKGIFIDYGPSVRKKGRTTTTIEDVRKAIRGSPRMQKHIKGVVAVRIENYRSPSSFAGEKRYSRAKIGYLKEDDKGERKPIIILRANPYHTKIKQYGRKKAEKIHREETKQEIAHELVHYQQYKRGERKIGEKRSPKQEREALVEMKKF